MTLEYCVSENVLKITVSDNYIYFSDVDNHQNNNDKIADKLLVVAEKENLSSILVDGKNLEQWDSSLAVIFFEIIKIAENRNIKINIDTLPENLKSLLNLAFSVDRKPNAPTATEEDFVEQAGSFFLDFINSFKNGIEFIKEAFSSMKNLFFRRAIMRKEDFLFALEECSYKAVPIVSLISFMVGLILAFVGSIQLKVFGAEIYVASLVSIAMVRIMGAVMTAIIMSGRTGANYAATIGTMQVNEEIDALKTMGIPPVDFLLLPRILSLLITMPFLTLLSNIVGIIGGASVGIFMLNIPPQKYYQMSMDVLSLNNFLIGIFHGFVFGAIIALCGCYYGINCGKDADSVGKSTTQSVVASIVWIIIATGIITLFCEVFGI